LKLFHSLPVEDYHSYRTILYVYTWAVRSTHIFEKEVRFIFKLPDLFKIYQPSSVLMVKIYHMLPGYFLAVAPHKERKYHIV